MKKYSSNEAWTALFEKYDIENKIKSEGYFEIYADQIREFREARLMAKWDSSETLPDILKRKKVNILPTSRSSYILSDFKLYKEIPELTEHVTKMQAVELPDFESIDINNITSESQAINILTISQILDDFLDEKGNVTTFNGRETTPIFDFKVNRLQGTPLSVHVNKAQCEIDGGLENANSIVIMEAKNVVYPDFHVRQLYYPYRLWRTRVKKPIRLVFAVYSNQIYRLFEYEFSEFNNYSSIVLLQEKNYTLQDTEINFEELLDLYNKTKVLYDDRYVPNDKKSIPFVQANSFERVISLLEIIGNEAKTEEEIAELMQFEPRQSGYYFNAGRYLGIFEKNETMDENGNKVIVVDVTRLGRQVLKLNYKERQLKLVELILQHKIFNELFIEMYRTGITPEQDKVENTMRKYSVCTEKTINRRSSSVIAWLKWIFRLPNITSI